jgi:hypothetical protein
MTTPEYSVPQMRIMQTSFVVPDLRQAAADFSAAYGIGPWLVFGRAPIERVRYRGEPIELDISVAAAFQGDMMFELVQPNDDQPSAFQEVVQERGYGLHHFAMATTTFEQSVEDFLGRGYQITLEARSPEADGGSRVVFLDTPGTLPAMLEVMELDAGFESALQQLHQLSVDWDGSDPVRDVSDVPA